MQDPDPTYPPERSGRIRRTRSTRRPDAPSRWREPEPDPLEVAVEERLDEGMRAIEEQASSLMREIAGEMWRASGADVADQQTRILNLISRDQTVRSLIASSDERFQAIALRTARLEDSLAELAESSRQVREAVQMSASSVHQIAESPTLQGVDRVRSQLEQVEHHIAATFEHLNERDDALTRNIQEQVVEHGRLIEREASRIVEALQAHVPSPAAPGTALDPETSQQLQLLYERIDLQRRAIAGIEVALERLVETRTLGLAQLIRSDAQALRDLIVERGEAQEAALRETLDQRLSALTIAGEERAEALARGTEEQATALARTTEEQVSALTLAVSAAIERGFSRLSAEMDERIDAMVESRMAADDRLDDQVGEQLDDRLTALARMIRSDNRVLAERIAEAGARPGEGDVARQTLRAVKELQASLGTDPSVLESVDRRFQVMSEQLHQETQSTAEAMVKVAEVLGGKIDRLTVRVDEGVGNDLQIVIDRMSDAIQAMSGRVQREPRRYDAD
ncbi:MAG: hypothetical protein U0V56_01535 [Actinomycetota bacterium]